MREVTKLMIKKYALNKLKYDFMGYTFERTNELTFHHLIVPKKDCKGMEAGGYLDWNGSLLVFDSHEYLHRIQTYDDDRFQAITFEMIDENTKGHLDMDNLRAINDVLESFEREYLGKRTKSGNEIIKEEYLHRLLLKR